MWELIHDESITASENIERNSQGLEIAYYHTAFDAFDDRFAAAAICYGWDVIQVESGEKDGFLSRVADSDDITHAITCDHDFTCEEIFHAAQVVLDNEECDGCEPCARYGKKEGV